MASGLAKGSEERDEQVDRAVKFLELLDEARELFNEMEDRDSRGMGHAVAYGMEQHLYDSDRRWTANSLYSEIAQYRDELAGYICEECGLATEVCGCDEE